MEVIKQNLKNHLRDLVEQLLDDGIAFQEVRSALIEIARSLRKPRLQLALTEADRMIERAVIDLKLAASQYGDINRRDPGIYEDTGGLITGNSVHKARADIQVQNGIIY